MRGALVTSARYEPWRRMLTLQGMQRKGCKIKWGYFDLKYWNPLQKCNKSNANAGNSSSLVVSSSGASSIEGLPLFFLELSIVERMQRSAINCWRDVHHALVGTGVTCLMVSLMLCLYYVVVIAWCCYYFLTSFKVTINIFSILWKIWAVRKNAYAARNAKEKLQNEMRIFRS